NSVETLIPGSTLSFHQRTSSDAGIQLMVCASSTGCAAPGTHVAFTAMTHVCDRAGVFGAACEPNRITKYRTLGSAGAASRSSDEIWRAGDGVRCETHPAAAAASTITQQTWRDS